MEVNGELHAPALLTLRERPTHNHWMGWLGGPQNQSGRCENEKNYVYYYKKEIGPCLNSLMNKEI
jgi:hypothetical protein